MLHIDLMWGVGISSTVDFVVSQGICNTVVFFVLISDFREGNVMSSSNCLMQYRRFLSVLLSFSIGFGGVIPIAWGQNSSSGTGGSITMRVLNADTGEHVPSHLLRPNIEYRIEMKAFDANGKAIGCKPSFSTNQGVTGNQIGLIDGDIMTMGTGFGQAEVVARCAELPNVEAKMPVANITLMTPAEKKAAAQAAAAKDAAVMTKMLAGLAGLAAVGGTLALVNSLTPEEPGKQIYLRYGGSDKWYAPYSEYLYNSCVQSQCPNTIRVFGYPTCTCHVY